MNEQIASVRAIPAPGHKYRRRAGLAWAKEPAKIRVVDEPRKDAGPDGVIELSPAQMQALLADPHIAVSFLGADSAASPEEMNALKADAVKMAADLGEARRDLAFAQEEMARLREGKQSAEDDLRRAGEKVRALEEQLSTARAQIVKGGKSK